MNKRPVIKGCKFCEKYGNDWGMPNHFASSDCESGGRNHCTCDKCF